MNIIYGPQNRPFQKLLLLLLITCFLFPAAQAVIFSAEEKTIFTAEEGAYANGMIDSGNILISEIHPDSDGPGWIELYRYNISTDETITLPAKNPDGRNMDICGDTVIWTEVAEKNDFAGPKIALQIYQKKEDILVEIPDKFNSVSDLKLINGSVVITGRDSFMLNSGSGMSDIYIYYLNKKTLKHYEIPGSQGSVSSSGDYIAFHDDRFGQMKDTVHIMNLKDSVSWQIGDEKKGVYSSPDISGENIVYRFDEDFGSFLKEKAAQQLLLTDISTNKTKVIASPRARISEPKIDGDNIVWSDKRNKEHYTIWLYNLNEERETLVADTSNEYPGTVDISGNTVMWSDTVDDHITLKIMELFTPEVPASDEQYTEPASQNSESTDHSKSYRYPDKRKSEISPYVCLIALIFALYLLSGKKVLEN